MTTAWRRLAGGWQRIPLDLRALLAISIAMFVVHRPFIAHGMCFNDPSWYFHFGHRTLEGAVPYRDYVFQVGPLPIYVDAAFQAVFGEKYLASLYAALLIKTLRVFVMWMTIRRLADVRTASMFAVFCALDPMFSFAHHWSTSYAELWFTLGGLFMVIAWQAAEAARAERRVVTYLALAGVALGLVVSARQASVIMIGLMVAATAGILALHREFFTLRRLAALGGGFVVGLALVFGALAALGVLEPAIQQMFIEAAEKKAVGGVNSVLDAISGGAFVVYLGGLGFTWWGAPLHYLGISVLLVAGAVWLGARTAVVSTRSLAMLALPVLMVVAMLSRYAALEQLTDLPRTFLSLVTALAILVPERCRRWLGLPPVIVVALGAVPLASDWALEMSFPGRGWGDVWALFTGGGVLALVSTRASLRARRGLATGLALAGVMHFVVMLGNDRSPFAKYDASDGTLSENAHQPKVRGKTHPMFRGLHIPAWRARTVEWLTYEIAPGSTCLVYANLPSLYDILDCRNPTKIDTTIVDYPSLRDTQEMVVALRAAPPDYILAHQKMWMSPPIELDLGGKLGNYESWNPRATMTLHLGLRSIIDQYEDLGTVGNMLGLEQAKLAGNAWDGIDQIKVYRRKR